MRRRGGVDSRALHHRVTAGLAGDARSGEDGSVRRPPASVWRCGRMTTAGVADGRERPQVTRVASRNTAGWRSHKCPVSTASVSFSAALMMTSATFLPQRNQSGFLILFDMMFFKTYVNGTQVKRFSSCVPLPDFFVEQRQCSGTPHEGRVWMGRYPLRREIQGKPRDFF